jgi:uncharacterized protein (TIGR02145 family)
MKRLLFFALACVPALSSCQKEEVTLDGITWATRNVGRPGKFVPFLGQPGRLYNFVDAQTACPEGWRLPTHAELASLADADSQWTVDPRGRVFGSRTNNVFLPTTGNREANGRVKGRNKFGAYWSSTQADGAYGYGLYFDDTAVFPSVYGEVKTPVFAGYSVRCVKGGTKPESGTETKSGPDEKGVTIDGVVWATRNVGEPGQFVARPEDWGNFYSFERAQTVCPDGWRIPTQAEMVSLSKSDSKWEVVNDRQGLRLGSGDDTLFLPAAGFNNGLEAYGTFHTRGDSGNYWSSEKITESDGFRLGFTYKLRRATVASSEIFAIGSGPGSQFRAGFSVRCVRR